MGLTNTSRILAVIAMLAPTSSWQPLSQAQRAPRRTAFRLRALDGGGSGGGPLAPLNQVSSLLRVLGSTDLTMRSGGGATWEQDVGATEAWVLADPDQTPWCALHFLGGAGFGAYPRVAYASLLEKLGEACGGGVVFVCTPFEAGLDHAALAASAAADFDDVVGRWTAERQWPEGLRTYRLGHSLGGKLHILNAAAGRCGGGGGGDAGKPQIGLVAYNNFGLSDSVKSAFRFLEALQGSLGGGGDAGGNGESGVPPFSSNPYLNGDLLKGLLGAASMAVESSGFDFNPTAEATRSQAVPQALRTATVRLFTFREDDLDSSARDFLETGYSTGGEESEGGVGGYDQEQGEGSDEANKEDRSEKDDRMSGMDRVAATGGGRAKGGMAERAAARRAAAAAAAAEANGAESGGGEGGSPVGKGSGGAKVKAEELSGGHLTPIFLRISAAEVAERAGAAEVLLDSGVLDARGAVSFGDEGELEALVGALSAWLLGRPPQPPSSGRWLSSGEYA